MTLTPEDLIAISEKHKAERLELLDRVGSLIRDNKGKFITDHAMERFLLEFDRLRQELEGGE